MGEHKLPKLGAMGSHSEGKIDDSDEGDLRLAVGHDKQNVFVQFGKPVKWLGLPKSNAIRFAELILVHALELPDEVIPGGGKPS